MNENDSTSWAPPQSEPRERGSAMAPDLPRWRILGKTVRGASHLRSGLPNQDAISWAPNWCAGSRAILAVADGHGSAKSFRSDIGAALAVRAAIAEHGNLLAGHPNLKNLPAIQRAAEEILPREIVRRWERLVKEHVAANPILPAELEALEKAVGRDGIEAAQADPVRWYGATIVTALLTESFVLYLQLGDGDILVVSDSGEVTRPVTPDARLLANDTTSLCLAEAWQDFRVVFHPFTPDAPALVLISTDGYLNSFVDEASFLKIGSDILNLVRTEGLNWVNDSLEQWLAEASKFGSGDDITLGIACRVVEKA